jgi:hypothetical protein
MMTASPTAAPWETGLASIPDAEQSRNVILPENTIRLIIAAAYRDSPEFGLLIEVAAVTGLGSVSFPTLRPPICKGSDRTRG